MTSLYTMTGGIMGLHPAAGRRSRRRLVMSLMALAVGATLGAGAPQALAGPRHAKQGVAPRMTLKVRPSSSRPNKIITVTGAVWPVEIVGENIALSVQRKALSGKWTAVSLARRQVQYAPPASWQGTFDSRLDWVGMTHGTMENWQGQVSYGSPKTDLQFHYVDYSMTSATGSLTALYYIDSDAGVTMAAYSGTPVDDYGSLRWYFAESRGTDEGTIPKDSYVGGTQHEATGMWTTIWFDHTTTVADNMREQSHGDIWLPEDGPRPLGADGHMSGTRSRIPGPGLTHVSEWDLTSSELVVPYGTYSWKYTPKKKGLYRVRAAIAKTANHAASKSPWRNLTVK